MGKFASSSLVNSNLFDFESCFVVLLLEPRFSRSFAVESGTMVRSISSSAPEAPLPSYWKGWCWFLWEAY